MIKLILYWLGVSVDYLIAGGLFVGGLYVVLALDNRLGRIVGIVLLSVGIAIGSIAYGKTIGGASILAQWEAANKQAKIDAANRDIEIQKITAAEVDRIRKELTEEKKAIEKDLNDYREAVARMPKSVRECRTITPVDRDRLCHIWPTAAQCKGSK